MDLVSPVKLYITFYVEGGQSVTEEEDRQRSDRVPCAMEGVRCRKRLLGARQKSGQQQENPRRLQPQSELGVYKISLKLKVTKYALYMYSIIYAYEVYAKVIFHRKIGLVSFYI